MVAGDRSSGRRASVVRASRAVNGRVPVRPENGEGRITFTVISPSPETGRMVAETLSRAGLRGERPAELLGREGHGGAEIAVVDARSGDGVSTLRRVRDGYPHLPILALVDSDDLGSHVTVLREGATTALPFPVSDGALLTATHAAIEGRAVLPTEAVHRLSLAVGEDHLVELEEMDGQILTRLAHGDSIRDVADALGYSERQMHRKANDLYGRLGASGRAEALVKAASQGLVQP